MQEFLDVRYFRDQYERDIISLVRSETKTTITLVNPIEFFFEYSDETNQMELYTKDYISGFVVKSMEVILQKKDFRWVKNKDEIQEHFIDWYLTAIGQYADEDGEFEGSNVINIKDVKPKFH